MKRAPWLAVPLATVDGLIRIYERRSDEWPREVAALDLARHLDIAASVRPVAFPSRRALAKRWGWRESSVRGLLAAASEWSDPTKEPSAGEEPNVRPEVAQASPISRPPETVEPDQFSDVSPRSRPDLAHNPPNIRPDESGAASEESAFDHVLSEVGTTVAITTHNPHPTTHIVEHIEREPAPLDRRAARSLLAEIEAHPGGPERRGCPSIDVLDEDPGDACSWPACLGHGCSVMPTSSADKRTDLAARLRQLPVAADSNLAAGGIAAAAVIRDALGIAAQSTAPPAPATPQAAAPPPKTSSVMAPQVDPGAADGLFGAVPEPKPKKKKAKKTAAPDPAAWQICADHWSTVIGRPHGLSMERGGGQSLMEAIQAHGAALIVRRFAYLAADGNGNGRWMRDNKVPITAAVPEGSSKFTTKIDRAAVDWEDAKIAGAGAHDASGGAGRVDSWSGWDGASGRQSGARGGWDAWGDGLAEIARGKPVDFIDVELVENKRLEVYYDAT